MRCSSPQPNPETLDDLVKRIVRACQPRRIILFGSAARGEMTEQSDLDVLVVLASGADVRTSEDAMYSNMIGFGIPNDLVVVTEDDVIKYGENPYLVIHSATQEGRELYRAAG